MKNILKIIFILLTFIELSVAQNNNPGLLSGFHLSDKLNDNSLPLIFGDTLPADFPKLTVSVLDNPAPGLIFMEAFGLSGNATSYIMVLDSTGKPVYYAAPPIAGIDFKKQPNGLFSYAIPFKSAPESESSPLKVPNIIVAENLMNTSFANIDVIQMQNNYLADMHDFIVLPNGNYLLLGYEYIPVDMSKLIAGGNPNATVIGTVIQELDNKKNCVFQWRSLDHIPILETMDNPLNTIFEHTHGNAMFPDADGNLILSLPVTLEIIKIDMVTGKILWRLGGNKNEFDIQGEHQENKPYYFSMQHDVKRLSNGNLLFLDNGSYKDPWFSRAVEYELNEASKTAKLVWEYRNSPDISSYAIGSAQRLPNGNTLIDWGVILDGPNKTVSEVTPDKKEVFALTVPQNLFSYRAHKYDNPYCSPIANVKKEVLEGNTYTFSDTTGNTGVLVAFDKIFSNLPNKFFRVKKYDCAPLFPLFIGESPVVLPLRYEIIAESIDSVNISINIILTSLPQLYNKSNLKLYHRQTIGSGTFTMLETNMDGNGNLTAKSNDFGEYILGFTRVANDILPPSLISPENNKDLINNQQVNLVWSPTGRYDSFKLVIRESESNTVVYNRSGIDTPNVPLKCQPNKTYCWQVNTQYRDLQSDWSETRCFTCSDQFIKIDLPNGGETWKKDTGNIIRWNTNLKDSVSISLYKDGVLHSTVNDSVLSLTNAYSWKIPKSVPSGTGYKIQIRSRKNSTYSTISENDFTITDGNSVPETKYVEPLENAGVFPNPFEKTTNFNFAVNSPGLVSIKIFTIEGFEIKTIINNWLEPGNYKYSWSPEQIVPGVYVYKITSGKTSITGKMILIK